VLIDGSQEFYCSIFRNSETELRKAAAKNKFIGASPRYVMEAIGMTLIAIFAYIATQEQGGVGTVIPVLGTLALAAQRVLPAIQQIYSSYNSIKGSKYSLKDVIALLEQQLPYYSSEMPPIPIKFNKSIVLKNISFRYRSDLPWVLKDFNLTLNKSKHIGFIGVTGSGKSTLLDIVMGLLSQTQGEMLIDDQVITNKNYRSWQAHIAHVPQSVYLSDNSIEENIAFGSAIEKIDGNRVIKAAKQAQILELVESLPDGFQTRIGERGVRLSGGQRQRIGIARALYKRASVLIFDEATSALDNETESSIMQTIKNLDKDLTVLIIAHRLTTLKDCDQIVKLGVNNTVEILEYKEII
jgi:ATP-binding cassette, subfamily B, bacterial PglK